MLINRTISILFMAALSSAALGTETSQGQQVEFEADQAVSNLASPDVLIYSKRIKMPYGQSVFTDFLSAPSSSQALRLRVTADSNCNQAPYGNLYVRSTEDRAWHLTTFNNYINYHRVPSFDAIRIDINQPYYASMTC